MPVVHHHVTATLLVLFGLSPGHIPAGRTAAPPRLSGADTVMGHLVARASVRVPDVRPTGARIAEAPRAESRPPIGLLINAQADDRSRMVVRIHLRRGANTVLKVYNVLGKEVASQVLGRRNPGRYDVSIDGGRIPRGVYFYRLFEEPTATPAPRVIIR